MKLKRASLAGPSLCSRLEVPANVVTVPSGAIVRMQLVSAR